MRIWQLILVSILSTSVAFGVDYGADGSSFANTVGGYFKGNTTDRLVNPITTTATGTTVDGSKTYSGQMTCNKSTAHSYLDLSMTVQSTGDVTINAQIDRDFNGAKEYSYSAPKIASGICTNGIVSCDAGTWNNCKYYTWGYNGTITLTETGRSSASGCYCLNNSCGGVAAKAPESVLQSLGGGITSQMSKYNKNYLITKTSSTPSTASYWGQDAASCNLASGPASLPTAGASSYSLGGLDVALANESANPDSAYSVFNAGVANASLAIKTNECTIKNAVSIVTKMKCKVGQTENTASGVCLDGGHGSQEYSSASSVCSGKGMRFPTASEAISLPSYGGSAIWSSYQWFQVSGGCGGYPRTDWVVAYSGGTAYNKLYNVWCDGIHYQSPVSAYWCVTDKTPQADLSLAASNQCGTYETDNQCTLKEEKVCDELGGSCTVTIRNGIKISSAPPQICYTTSYSGASYLVCAKASSIDYTGSDGSAGSFPASPSGFTIKRTYECKSANDTNFDDIKKVHASIQVAPSANKQDFSYSGQQKDQAGNWAGIAESGTINFTPPGTIKYCEVIRDDTTKQVVYTDGTNKTNATTSPITKTVEIKECTGADYNTCPTDATKGETVKRPCGVINDMAEVIGTMEAVSEASKDMVCSQD